VFPSFEEFNNGKKKNYRDLAVSQIDVKHDIVLRKMAEICGDEWTLDLLHWMYLVHDQRLELILEYRHIIESAVRGEIEIGTREEAFKDADK